MAKILIVEDSLYQQKAIKDAFEKGSSSDVVVFANNADEALEVLQRNRDIDIVFVDYMLEGTDGIELTKRIIANGYDIPIVLMTAYGSTDLVLQTMKSGAFDYIIKDKDYHRLLPEVCRKTLQSFRASKESVSLYNLLLEFSDLLVETTSLIKELTTTPDIEETLIKFLQGAIRMSGASGGAIFVKQCDDPPRVLTEGVSIPEKDLFSLTRLNRSITSVSPEELGLRLKESFATASYYPLPLGQDTEGGLLLLFEKDRELTKSAAAALELFIDSAAASVINNILFEKVLKSQKLWQATMDAIEDPIVVINKEGIILKCNKTFASAFQLSPKELIGMRLQDINRKSSIAECFREALKKCVQKTEEITIEGKTFLVSVFPVYMEDEDIMVMTLKDITEITRLKEQLYFADKLASLGRLVGGVAHEINNPLTGIMGYTELLKMKLKEPELQRMLDSIYRSAERCKRIIENLLTFSRQRPPEFTLVNLNDLLDSTIELRQYWLRKHNIEVIKDYEELPHIKADPQQLQQVFLNLLMNAEYALVESKKDKKMLIIKTSYDRQHQTIQVSITDNGTGIPPEILPKIFDPFFTTKEVNEGTGLGLSIAYSILKEHNATIHVESTYEQGTTFKINIPVKRT